MQAILLVNAGSEPQFQIFAIDGDRLDRRDKARSTGSASIRA